MDRLDGREKFGKTGSKKADDASSRPQPHQATPKVIAIIEPPGELRVLSGFTDGADIDPFRGRVGRPCRPGRSV
jgi:hypothetical protein